MKPANAGGLQAGPVPGACAALLARPPVARIGDDDGRRPRLPSDTDARDGGAPGRTPEGCSGQLPAARFQNSFTGPSGRLRASRALCVRTGRAFRPGREESR